MRPRYPLHAVNMQQGERQKAIVAAAPDRYDLPGSTCPLPQAAPVPDLGEFVLGAEILSLIYLPPQLPTAGVGVFAGPPAFGPAWPKHCGLEHNPP